MARSRRQSGGLALVLVLIVTAVAAVIGMSMLYSTSIQAAVGANVGRSARAKYLAESGIQHALYLLQTDLATLVNSSASAPLGPYYADGTDDYYAFYCQTIAEGQYRLCCEAVAGGGRQRSQVTVTRESAARVTSPATVAVADSSSLGAYLTVNGDFRTNGSLLNRAYINGNASAGSTISDPYARITGTKTPYAPKITLPAFQWSDYLQYWFYTRTYQAASTELIRSFGNDHALAQGRAITPSNPGGVVNLRPLEGGLVEIGELTMTGTLVVEGDLLLKGPIVLEAVEGFPAVVASGKIIVRTNAQVSVKGLVKSTGGFVPEVIPVFTTVTVDGGIVSSTSVMHPDVRGANTVRYVQSRNTVYDFQCRNSLPKVTIVSWDD